MANRRITPFDFSRYPSTTRKVFTERRSLFEKKLGLAFPHVQKLEDFKRLFDVTPTGEPLYGKDYASKFLAATTSEHIKKAFGYFERARRREAGAFKSPFSHIIAAMNILRPDLSPLAFNEGKPLFDRIISDGGRIKPFISMNDFSFVASFYKDTLPSLLTPSLYNNMHSLLIQKFGPQIDWTSGIEKVPFAEPQTDNAVKTICDFIKRYKNELMRTGNIENPKIKELNDALGLFKYVKGMGIEFSYAPKDLSFYRLGNKTGDCSAVRVDEMYDKEHENIFYEAPLWVGMPNYQVLEVSYDGKFALKFHMVISRLFDKWVLMADAAETVPEMRDTATRKDEKLINVQDQLFTRSVSFLRNLGRQMALPVLADRFSCNSWLAGRLKAMPVKLMEFEEDVDRSPFNDPLLSLMNRYSSETKTLMAKHALRPHIQTLRFDHRDEVREGYKLLSIIDGFKEDLSIPLRGI
jgi:hypothetical protein